MENVDPSRAKRTWFVEASRSDGNVVLGGAFWAVCCRGSCGGEFRENIDKERERVDATDLSLDLVVDVVRGVDIDEGVRVYGHLHHAEIPFTLCEGRVGYEYKGVRINQKISENDYVDFLRDNRCIDTLRKHETEEFTTIQEARMRRQPWRTALGVFRPREEIVRNGVRQVVFEGDPFGYLHPALPLVQISGIEIYNGSSGCPLFRESDNSLVGLISFNKAGYGFLISNDIIGTLIDEYNEDEKKKEEEDEEKKGKEVQEKKQSPPNNNRKRRRGNDKHSGNFSKRHKPWHGNTRRFGNKRWPGNRSRKTVLPLSCRFVETCGGRGFERARQTEIGTKHFNLTHFEEVKVFTTHHWMVQLYKLKPLRNRICGESSSLNGEELVRDGVILLLDTLFSCCRAEVTAVLDVLDVSLGPYHSDHTLSMTYAEMEWCQEKIEIQGKEVVRSKGLGKFGRQVYEERMLYGYSKDKDKLLHDPQPQFKNAVLRVSPRAVLAVSLGFPPEMTRVSPLGTLYRDLTENLVFTGSGTIIECEKNAGDEKFSTTILAGGANLFIHTNGVQPSDFEVGQVEVHLANGDKCECNILACDFHYNLAVVNVQLATIVLLAKLRDLDDIMYIHVICRHPSSFKIIHADNVAALDRFTYSNFGVSFGRFSASYPGLDCKELYSISIEDPEFKDICGSPVINCHGEVIGILAFETTSLPSNIVSRWWNYYKNCKKYCRPWLGLNVANLQSANFSFLEQFVQRFPNVSSVIIVPEVVENSAAVSSGLRRQEVIEQCDGASPPTISLFSTLRTIGSTLDLFDNIWDKAWASVKLSVLRQTEHVNVKDICGSPVIICHGEVIGTLAFESTFIPSNIISRCWNYYKNCKKYCRPWLGLNVANLQSANFSFLEQFVQRFPNVSSVIIVPEVVEKSAAVRSRSRREDVILQCDGATVGSTLDVFDKIWDKVEASVELSVLRKIEYVNVKVTVDEPTPDNFYRWLVPLWRPMPGFGPDKSVFDPNSESNAHH